MKLKRELGLFEVTMYGVGLILGAGIYVLIGIAAGLAGNALWISFIIAAIIASFTGLSYAELSTLFPKEAAEYVYVKRTFNNEFLAFMIGWIILVSEVVGAATLALGFARYFHALFKVKTTIVAIVATICFSFLNFYGIRESAKTNIFFTLIELSGLFLIIFLGLPKIGNVNLTEITHGIKGIITAASFIFFAYIGFEDIVNLAEETKKPKKTIPLALILSIMITTCIYVLVSISTLGLTDWKELSTSEAPLALAASKVMGDSAFRLLGIIALFATANTLLVLLIVSSRMLYGMAKEGCLPKLLSKIHKKRRTPHISIFTIMVTVIGLALTGKIEFVANVTNLATFITFFMINLTLIVARYRIKKERKFKVPLNVGRFPLLSLFGLLSCGFMISQFKIDVATSGLLFISIGWFIYYLFKNKLLPT
ncbi:MAG TPA: amino acid permease [Candidatus Aenigmarchaeota archaeon]|nr:amino acid permease [Candidatus Aenigmarchaeota archaeon]